MHAVSPSFAEPSFVHAVFCYVVLHVLGFYPVHRIPFSTLGSNGASVKFSVVSPCDRLAESLVSVQGVFLLIASRLQN